MYSFCLPPRRVSRGDAPVRPAVQLLDSWTGHYGMVSIVKCDLGDVYRPGMPCACLKMMISRSGRLTDFYRY
jgi:hypothetical protein